MMGRKKIFMREIPGRLPEINTADASNKKARMARGDKSPQKTSLTTSELNVSSSKTIMQTSFQF